jgi:F0F1-type ATP synthase epsilon subunit
MAQTFHVDVFSLDKKIFSGEVSAISSFNALGPFDLLNLHSNFISTIEKELRIHKEGGEKVIPLATGVLRCLNTHVSIFIG